VALLATTEVGSRGVWTIVKGSGLPAPGASAESCPLLVSRQAADSLDLEPGAALNLRVTLPDQQSALPLVACRVVGIAAFAFASADDNAMATTMGALAAAKGTDEDQADLVLVASHPSAGADAAARAISRLRPDLHAYSNADVVAQFNRNGFTYFRQISVVLSTITLSFAFLLVATLLTVSVNQRLGEIAALRALGIRRFRIAAMLLWESAVLVGLGGLLALPVGGLLALQLDRLLRQMPGLPERLHFFVFDTSAVVQHALLLAVTAVVAAVYPIWLTARLPIAETLRREVVG
jgi:putative ABC transport system permease protein